jgi:hypothetical protein
MVVHFRSLLMYGIEFVITKYTIWLFIYRQLFGVLEDTLNLNLHDLKWVKPC